MSTSWTNVLTITTPFTIYLQGKKLCDGITEKENKLEANQGLQEWI